MVDAVFHYFKVKKRESLFWIGIGVISLLLTFFIDLKPPILFHQQQ